MPKLIDRDGEYTIQLTLSKNFIKRYNLINVVNSFYHHYFVDFNEEGFFPYIFIPDTNFPQAEYKEFLSIYRKLTETIGLSDQQADEILFLSKTFEHFKKLKQSEIYRDEYQRNNGKLLVELIKAPIENYNLEDLHNAFSEEDEYLADKEEFIITYLSTVTDKPIKSFLDKKGNLNLKKIPSDIADKLIRKIRTAKNYTIELDDSIPEPKQLIVSKNIKLSFSYQISDKTKYVDPIASDFNETAIVGILKNLWDKDKIGESLYNALLKHDYLGDGDITELKNIVGHWNRDKHDIYNLQQVYDIALNYFDTNRLIISTKGNTKSMRDRFLLKLFVFFGIVNEKGQFSSFTTMSNLNTQLLAVNNQSVSAICTMFNNKFKNLKL
jgi:hypothetical protein